MIVNSNRTTATITTDNDSYASFVLAHLHVAAARTRLVVVEIDSIGAALAGAFIDADTTIAWTADIGVDLMPSTVIPSTSAA